MATDVAARGEFCVSRLGRWAAWVESIMYIYVHTCIGTGLDVNSVTHVINFDLPDEFDSYVHRIGYVL